jgi:4-hydroxythreonine-4-phosphate dehydrogenase
MQMMQLPVPLVNLAITTGEPAGVGPEISVAAARQFLAEQPRAVITLLGDSAMLVLANKEQGNASERLQIQTVPLRTLAKLGVLNEQNAQYVIDTLNQATDGCLSGQFDAMITAPIQKSVINLAGTPFTGHTEYLAERCHVKQVVMMLCATLQKGTLGLNRPRQLRVALATTHLPLKAVSAALSQKCVSDTIQIVQKDLRTKFGISNPVIRVAGLNPHAGESGYLGKEEILAIAPAIESAKALGINVSGPYPGDTLFDAASLDTVDAYIAMYHDQGLAPFKFVTFSGGVNVTLGLPIIRTSVDHGTALDIAGKGIADPGSMLEALRLAYQLALHKKKIA